MTNSLRRILRPIRRRPSVAFVATGILSVAIGAATAVFTLVNAVVLRELPFRDPDRLVWMWNARLERSRAPFSILDLEDYRAENHVLADLAAFTNWTANLTGTGEAERLEGIRVEPGFFDLLGTDAAHGRVFHRGDDPDERRVVITDGLWRRRLGGDASIVGRAIDLSGVRYTVAGILPAGFLFPVRSAEVAIPLATASHPMRPQRGYGFVRAVARLRTGVSIEDATRDLDDIGRRLQNAYPADDGKKTGVTLFPLQQEIVGDARQLLSTLMAAVALVLVVAAANVANLLLVWLAARHREFEISAALGASRARTIAQIAIEAGVLVAASGIAGLWLAAIFVRGLVWWMAGALPRVSGTHLDLAGVAFGCAATSGVALICAILPAVHTTARLGSVLQDRAATAAPDRQRLRRALVAAQVAVAVVLLAAIGLTVRSILNLRRVDLGFEPRGVVSIQLSLPPARYASSSALVGFADALTPRLRALPGVRSAAAVSLLPLSGLLRTEDFRIVGRPEPPLNEVPQAHYRVVTPGYFETMGVRLIRGRTLTEDDRASTQPVGIVSRTLAEQFWADASPVGAHLRVGNGTDVEIVGVTADVKQSGLDRAPTPDLYVPLRQAPQSEAPLIASRMFWVVSTGGDPERIVDSVRAEVHALDGDIASSGARAMVRVVEDAIAPRRFNAIVLAVFAQLAVLLAAAGVYAVTAFSVQQRTREIGVRMALGARRTDVVMTVLGSEWRAVVVGAAVGATGAFLVARLLASTLFHVGGIDSRTLAAALAVLAVMAGAGCYIPVRRAASINPVDALR